MSDQSFSGLCERMKGWSVTLGWDAVVAMSRTKVNSLLEQQYISRFKSECGCGSVHLHGRFGL